MATATNTQPAIIANYTPKVIDRYLHVTQDGYAGVVRYHHRNPAIGIRAIVIHVQEGSNWGSWQWFHTVKASSTVFIGKNGDIWNLVPEGYAPWTNGDVDQPDQTAIALMNRFGWDPNTWCLTIEEEGNSGGLPYTEGQFTSTVWKIWTWLREHPTIEAVHILRHGQINSVTRPHCPERAPYPFMQQVFAALSGASLPVTPDAPTQIYRKPWQVRAAGGALWDGRKDTVTDTGIAFHADKRTVSIGVDALNCRQWASNTANLTRDPLAKGETVQVLGWCEGEEVAGERRWWVTTYGTRLWAGGTVEKPRKAAPTPVAPGDGVSKPDQGNNRDLIPVVLNGNTYYPVERKGDERTRTMRLTVNGNVRLWAATHAGSPVQRVQPKGSTVKVSHWVKGEPVEGNDKWYVIAEGNDPIRTGGRIWSGLVEEV